MRYQKETWPAPQPTPGTEAFWRGTGEGELLLPLCQSCGRVHWYPRMHCPFCHSKSLVWQPAEGGGTLYSFAPMRRVPEPFIVAYVTLDEGPTLLTHVVGAAPASLSIGQRMRLTFGVADDGSTRIPLFTPADAVGHASSER